MRLLITGSNNYIAKETEKLVKIYLKKPILFKKYMMELIDV